VSCITGLHGGNFACGTENGIIMVYDPLTERTLFSYQKDSIPVSCMTTLLDGCIVSGHNNEIRIWDPNSGELLQELKGHKSKVTCLFPLPDGSLASGSEDGTIRIWRAEN